MNPLPRKQNTIEIHVVHIEKKKNLEREEMNYLLVYGKLLTTFVGVCTGNELKRDSFKFANDAG